jgi:hypothetical protein
MAQRVNYGVFSRWALLPVLVLWVAGSPARPAAAQQMPILLDGQTRLDGKISAVAPDFKQLDLGVVVAIPAGGKRTLYGTPPARSIQLTPDTYIYRKGANSSFLSPRDLLPGLVVTVIVTATPGSGELKASEVIVGGILPKVAPEPILPAVPPPTPPPPVRPNVAKFEPAKGCYLGAFVMSDENVGKDMGTWEETVGKGHASYLRYVGYGQPFPAEWVKQVRRVGAVPNLAFEPNDGLKDVKDSDYLRNFARTAAASGGPVFLRFASEMNGNWTAYHGNPKVYREKFQMVARIFHQEAPNVAMVWTPYCMPNDKIPYYYPGDAAVDWVGVNIYSVHHHNGRRTLPAGHEDPTRLLEPIYRRYAARKPIQISEYAATTFCRACKTAMPAFAIAKMQKMYGSLPTRFPRVKMIYWFSWDTIASGAAENNYSVASNEQVLATYRNLVRQPYFLARLPQAPARAKEAANPLIPPAHALPATGRP